MPGDDITVIVGGSDASAARNNIEESQAQAADTKVAGVSKKDEPIEKIIARLEKNLTEDMKKIVDAINGISSDKEKGVRDSADGLLDKMSNIVSPKDGITEAQETFKKANKLTNLKPQDINIVDQQWILGALLINTTLESMHKTLLKIVKEKTSGSGEKEKPIAPVKSSNEEGGKFSSLIIALKELPPVLAAASADLKKVSWSVLFKCVKNSIKLTKEISQLALIIKESEEELKFLAEIAPSLQKGVTGLLVTSIIATIALPFALPATISLFILGKMIPLYVNIAKQLFKNRDILEDFGEIALNLFAGTVFLGLAVIASALILPYIPKALLASLLLSVFAITTRILLKVMPGIMTTLFATTAALGMAVFYIAMLINIKIIDEISKYSYKDILSGLLNVGIVTAISTGIFVILGLIGPLILLGAISAMTIGLGMLALLWSMKQTIKAGKLAVDALLAIGSLGNGVIDGADPADPKHMGSGIIGFLSAFGSKTFGLLILRSILPSAMLGLVGFLLIIAASLLLSSMEKFNKIGKEFFPAGVPIANTGPVRAIIGIISFNDVLENGVNGKKESAITWESLLAILPLTVYGILLKFASKSLQEGFDALAKIEVDLDAVTTSIKTIGTVLTTINAELQKSQEGKDPGAVGFLVKLIFGSDIGNSVGLLTGLLPLLILGFYGEILKKIGPPIKEGLAALADSTSGIEKLKIGDPNGPLAKILSLVEEVGKTVSGQVGLFTNSEGIDSITNAIVGVVGSLPILVESITQLAHLKNQKEIDDGIANISLILTKMFGTDGGVITSIKGIKANAAEVDQKVFASVIQVVNAVKPLSEAVIGMGTLKQDQLTRGLSALKTLLEELSKIMGISGEGEKMGVIKDFIQIGMGAAANSVASHHPIFQIMDKLADPNFNTDTFDKNVKALKANIETMVSAYEQFNKLDSSKLNNFTTALTSFSNNNAISGIERFSEMHPELKLVADQLDRIAASLNKIADSSANLDKLSSIGEAPKSEKVSKAAAEKDYAATMAANNDTMIQYLESMRSIMMTWYEDGIKIKNPQQPSEYDKVDYNENASMTDASKYGEY